jgi:hypothetical protein
LNKDERDYRATHEEQVIDDMNMEIESNRSGSAKPIMAAMRGISRFRVVGSVVLLADLGFTVCWLGLGFRTVVVLLLCLGFVFTAESRVLTMNITDSLLVLHMSLLAFLVPMNFFVLFIGSLFWKLVFVGFMLTFGFLVCFTCIKGGKRLR